MRNYIEISVTLLTAYRGDGTFFTERSVAAADDEQVEEYRLQLESLLHQSFPDIYVTVTAATRYSKLNKRNFLSILNGCAPLEVTASIHYFVPTHYNPDSMQGREIDRIFVEKSPRKKEKKIDRKRRKR